MQDTPVVLLTGPRQSGKSTLVQTLVPEDWYFTLDDATVLASAQTDPVAFVRRSSGTVVIDEVQRVPELLLAIKASVDRDRRPGRFLLTGSANIRFVPRIADQAMSDYRRDPEPITVIGHSLGGDAAVKFAERLDAVGIPVSLLVTYDPTRFAHSVPPNVERYVNLYQSSNILGGGGDVVQGRGFHGHYASFDLKDRRGMFHTNMEKFGDIHDQLVSKIAALAATPASVGGEAIPLRIDIPANATIELWDSGLPVSAHAGDTLPTLAATYHVPLWALTQVNNLSEDAALTKGARIIVPRYLVPMAAPSAVSSHAASNTR